MQMIHSCTLFHSEYIPHSSHSRILFMVPVIGTLFHHIKEKEGIEESCVFKKERLKILDREAKIWGLAQVIAGSILLLIVGPNPLGLLFCGACFTSYALMWLPTQKNTPSTRFSRNNTD